MIVVLDFAALGSDNPFKKYSQPAFFTIVEDLTPEPRFQGAYVLRDSEGNLIRATDISSYLTEVSVWAAYNAERSSSTAANLDRQIHDLSVRVAVLKEVLMGQVVRVLTNEQAEKLGVKP